MSNTNSPQGILCTGASGLIGSRIIELLRHRYAFTQLGRAEGIDITRPETLSRIADDTTHEIVIHLAAKTDVDACENDKSLGEKGDAWKINVLGTKNIIEACRKGNKKLIFISTDFIFSGEDTPERGYTEESLPDPVNWYARTKYEGEKLVQASGISYIIPRIAYPYRAAFDKKKDFVRAIISRLQQNQEVHAITDHIMTPTFIDDIAGAIDTLLQQNATGIFHVVGSQFITPYDACLLIAKAYHADTSLIKQTTRGVFFKNRAPRAFNLSINNDKIKQLGCRMRSFEEGLQAMKEVV